MKMEFLIGIFGTVLFGYHGFLQLQIADDLTILVLVSCAVILVFLWMLLLKLNRTEKKLDKLLEEKKEE